MTMVYLLTLYGHMSRGGLKTFVAEVLRMRCHKQVITTAFTLAPARPSPHHSYPEPGSWTAEPGIS